LPAEPEKLQNERPGQNQSNNEHVQEHFLVQLKASDFVARLKATATATEK